MSKHIVFIAGEESGDQHAAKLLKSLLANEPDLVVSGLGGAHLQSLGMHNLMDLTKLAITGLTGVLGHLKSIKKAFKVIKDHLKHTSPDLVILVDYPGFNLRLAKWIKRHMSCPVIYYISPQIWAWKAERIEILRQCVNHVAVILPFEYELYRQQNIPVSYVGHPLLDSIKKVPSPSVCREHFSWSKDEEILALCPGSRRGEVTRHMPVLVQSLKVLHDVFNVRNIKIVIPVAESLEPEDFKAYSKSIPYNYELVSGQAQYVMQAANAVVVASGTASLESALLLKPTCIIYKSSWLNYYLAQRLMKVKYLGLSNLLLNRMALPELLQTDCNPVELAKMMNLMLNSKPWQNHLHQELICLHELLLPQDQNLLTKLVFKSLEPPIY